MNGIGSNRWGLLLVWVVLLASLPLMGQTAAAKKKALAAKQTSQSKMNVKTGGKGLAIAKPVSKAAPTSRLRGSKKTVPAPRGQANKAGPASAKKPLSSHGRAVTRTTRGARYAYRTGHGDRGVGTLKPPTRYTAPLPPPPVLEEAVPVVPVPVEPVLTGKAAIENPEQLDSFFAQLKALESGKDTGTVRMLQFGDSHTAADMFTGRMRSLFQVHFGNGGAGFTFAGHPFAGYRILGTSRSQTGGWEAEGVHFTQIVDTRLGMGGVANTARRANEEITLDAPCTKFQMEYLDQPDGGGFSLLEDGATLSTNSTDNALAPATLTATCTPDVIHHFEVLTDSAKPVRLFGFVTEQPGVTYEAIGLNGAEAGLMLRWDQPIFQGYLRERDPALIVLAYGTNEAGNHNWTYEAYRDLMGRLIDMLHKTVPGASILVMGPPDRSTRSGYGTRRHPAAWAPYSNTLHITSAQREACRTHGCAFWSWRDRMGGLGSMNRWVADGLAQPDHTHFTSRGYVQLADFLYSDILAAYESWKTASTAVSRVTMKKRAGQPHRELANRESR